MNDTKIKPKRKCMLMNVLKKIGLSMLLQLVILLLHLLIHKLFDFQFVWSYLTVILITYFGYVILKLPVYTVFTAQIITLLFLLITKEPGTYLCYTAGGWLFSFWEDVILIVFNMTFVQSITGIISQLTQNAIYEKSNLNDDKKVMRKNKPDKTDDVGWTRNE